MKTGFLLSIILACSASVANAETPEQCNLAATFAYALRHDNISSEQLIEWATQYPVDDRKRFSEISTEAANNIDALAAMSPTEFGLKVFEWCTSGKTERLFKSPAI